MKNKRKIIFRIIALALVIAVAACMFVIGRGHTVYFDNKELTGPDGTVYEPWYQIEVLVNGERVARLAEGDRGMVSTMGQDFKFEVKLTKQKGGTSIAVHEAENAETARALLRQRRAHYALESDYTEGSDLWHVVCGILDDIAQREREEV